MATVQLILVFNLCMLIVYAVEKRQLPLSRTFLMWQYSFEVVKTFCIFLWKVKEQCGSLSLTPILNQTQQS